MTRGISSVSASCCELNSCHSPHRSLMSDGADAVKYGLSQRATSSREEWAKRARNLLTNQNFAMAAKAFTQVTSRSSVSCIPLACNSCLPPHYSPHAPNLPTQAGDMVRSMVAVARQKRTDAANVATAGGASQRRRLLTSAAAQLIAAVSRSSLEAPEEDPVHPRELRRWVESITLTNHDIPVISYTCDT